MAKVFKILRKTDIQKRMTIPSKSLPYFPPLSGKLVVDFPAVDDGGRVWKFRIYTRSMKKNNKYRKPVLTKGWREFVCTKKLGVGDKVVFCFDKTEAGDFKCRVKVEKAVKVFGAVVAHKPALC